MTSISLFEADSATPWSAMPGWGIAADLTPPELINSRQLKVLRRLIAIGLIALFVLAVGGYVLAQRRNASASNGLQAVQSRTTQLEAQAHKYAGVTRLQGTVSHVQGQIAALMAGDVDAPRLMALLSSRLPHDMKINTELIAVTAPGSVGVGATGSSAVGTTLIGTMALGGTGHTLDDLSEYIDELRTVGGVTDVVPTSNVTTRGGTTFTLTLSLTSALLSHRFDIAKGTK